MWNSRPFPPPFMEKNHLEFPFWVLEPFPNDEEEIEDNDDDDECAGDDDDGMEVKGGEVTDRLWQIWPKVGDPRKRRFLKLCFFSCYF